MDVGTYHMLNQEISETLAKHDLLLVGIHPAVM